MTAVSQLHDLQELDLKISDLDDELVDVRRKLEDDSALRAAREDVERLGDRLEALNVRSRQLDLRVEELKENLGRVEVRLYGGAVTNARELTAAEEERGFIVEQQSREEDALLEVMVESDEADSAGRQARDLLARLESERPAVMAALREAEAKLDDELARTRGSREELAPAIPSSLILLYDSLRQSRSGRAVARVERGTCQGCRVALSTMELQRARGPRGVVQCDSCRRILYVV
jgi:predicted  nucleic acid-binding Zn-ribbon protein